MRLLRAWLLGGLLAGAPVRGVYAPIPEHEQGRALTLAAAVGMYYDTNIFGSSRGEIESLVYQFSPGLSFNASVTNRTFVSAGYRLGLDYVVQRPSNPWVDSHELSARLAHAFSPRTTLDISEVWQLNRNPEALLAGLPVNMDQSFSRNQLDGRLTTGVGPKADVRFKGRSVVYRYEVAALAQELDRRETLGGFEGAYAILPELKAVVEGRYQHIGYAVPGLGKDKTSVFGMVGGDYAWGRQLSTAVRLGLERRQRKGAADETGPFVEGTLKYDYGEKSFVALGYTYTFEETSNLLLYTDTQVRRGFVNVQHLLRPSLAASGSFTYEPSRLQGRPGFSPDRSEVTLRSGGALTWLGPRRWSVSLYGDVDRVRSDDPDRGLQRLRWGTRAQLTF